MSLNLLHRQILTLADEQPIRNLENLVKRLEIENPLDDSGDVAKAIMDRKRYDSVIVDLRCPTRFPSGEIHGIRSLRARRIGRTLAVNAEVNGAKTLSVVEKYLLDGLPGTLLWLVSHRYRTRPR
jgi:hypothetical protein